MQIVSLATPATLPHARVLGRSLARIHPDWRLDVVLVGTRRGGRPRDEPFRLRSVRDELGLDAAVLIAHHDEADLISMLVPLLVGARSRQAAEPVLHLPVASWVFGDLDPIVAELDRRGVVLAPRGAGEMPVDGLEPSPAALDRAGRIAPDLMGVDGSQRGEAFLAWWTAQLEAGLGSLDGQLPGARPEDRPWMRRMLELAPARFLAATLDDREYQAGMWNLHACTLGDGPRGVVIDGVRPLRLMDLGGFDPQRPFRLAAGSTRVRVSRSPTLRRLCREYAAALIAAGWEDAPRRGEIGRRLANGLVFDHAMSRLNAQAHMLGCDFGDVFTPAGTAAFLDWLTAPAPVGARFAVNRYVYHRVAHERPDVVRAYPDLDGADGDRYVRWCLDFGRREMGIPAELLPGGGIRPAAPEPLRTRRPATVDSGATVRGDQTAFGVRVTGYLSHTLGLGSAARGYAAALAAADVPVSTVSVPLHHLELPVDLALDYGRHAYEDLAVASGHAFDLVAVNADELPGFVARLGEDYFKGPRIGIWGWEVDRVPDRWAAAFELVDEIWVYSTYMRENLGALAGVPVVVLPPPVAPPVAAAGPLRLGVPDGFMFLFVFDYLSTLQRKNPVGLVAAFKRAFASGEGPQLLIKTINAPLRPLAEEELLWACDGRRDIHVIDRSLTGTEKDALMATCDCYVSLHRSEGFGLTLAEAMVLGKPVVATRYSGNLDFMTGENSYLVERAIRRVGPDCEIYPADAEWAEPDLDHAARLMRRVFQAPDEAARVGARARSDISRLLSLRTTGQAMRGRLQELDDERRSARGG
jgi:glycosyltransferase involved in cell wall biosynthesis